MNFNFNYVYLDFKRCLYDSDISIWLSVDPLAAKYPHQSNYMYCSGNPIMRIDPDGRDEWEVSSRGKVKWVAENTEKDVFYSTDKKGNRISSVEFQYGTIENLSSGKDNDINYQVLRVRGDEQGKELFEFLATPENFNLKAGQNVEWSRILTGEHGDKGLNFLTTSWETDREAGSYYLFKNQLKYGYTIRGADHNHPTNEKTPSGTGGEGGDIAVMKKWKREGNVSPNAQFRIYTPGLSEKYHPYNEKSAYQLNVFTVTGKK